MDDRSMREDSCITIKYDYLTEYLDELERHEAEQAAEVIDEAENARRRAVIDAAFEKVRLWEELDPKIPDETAYELFFEWAEMAERLARENDWEVLIQCSGMTGQIQFTGAMMVRDDTNQWTLGEPMRKLGEQAAEVMLSGEIRSGRPVFQICFQYDLFYRASQLND